MEQKKEASKAVDQPFPPMPRPVVIHTILGDLFDYLTMQQYAMRYADLVVAALKAQPAPTEAMPKLVIALPDYEQSRLVIASDEMIDGERVVCAAIKSAPTEAAQGEDSARLDADCDCDSPDWCKNYNRCHRQVCGFPLRGTTPKPV